MELLLPSLVVMLVLVLCFESLPCVRAQSTTTTTTTSPGSSTREEAKALDALLQQYAFKALVNPKTGTIYSATQTPSNLTGVEVAALRLRSGSLRRKGFQAYNEFGIPKGLIVNPYVERLVLVYQNLGNWSTKYYPLQNYTYLAPVLGLLAYDGQNLSATNLSPLDLDASDGPVSVKFRDVKPVPHGAVAKCVWFDLQGSANFSNVKGGNTCSTSQQGHISIVVKYTAPPPAPSPGPSGPAPKEGPAPSAQGEGEKDNNKKVWIIVGSVVGGLALLVLLSLLVLWMTKYKQKKKIQQMERAAEVGEPLQMASIGDTKAPAATVTRTQPTLEHEYAP